MTETNTDKAREIAGVVAIMQDFRYRRLRHAVQCGVGDEIPEELSRESEAAAIIHALQSPLGKAVATLLKDQGHE